MITVIYISVDISHINTRHWPIIINYKRKSPMRSSVHHSCNNEQQHWTVVVSDKKVITVISVGGDVHAWQRWDRTGSCMADKHNIQFDETSIFTTKGNTRIVICWYLVAWVCQFSVDYESKFCFRVCMKPSTSCSIVNLCLHISFSS
jgi:hypothetical protein